MSEFSEFIRFDNAYQHPQTGEMWVPASDGSGVLLPTGWYFERVTQMLPNIKNIEGPRMPGVPIRPWAFATLSSVGALLDALNAMTPPDVNLSIEPASDNLQFPYSHKQWQIMAKQGERRARINAGLLASNIARSTALLDGAIRQFPTPALQGAVNELMRELGHDPGNEAAIWGT